MSSLPVPAWCPQPAGLLPLESHWPEDSERCAAVGVVVFRPTQKNSHARIALIRRGKSLRSHSGQIGLPGGMRESFDRGPGETFLRELTEELGVPADAVHIHGRFTTETSLSGSPVIPVFASTSFPTEQLVPDAREVDTIFLVPWREFSIIHKTEFHFKIFGIERISPFFQTQQVPVWGLTAKILASAQFGE